MTETGSQFTKAQVAGVLGVKVQSIAHLFLDIAPSGYVDVADDSGVIRARNVATYAYEDLPVLLQQRCEAEARRQGFLNGRTFLEANAQPWQPAIPLNQVAHECRCVAEQLRRALAASIERKDCTALSAAEFEALGVADYHREFGKPITARHWRDLFKRTLQRDGGRENWQRLESYLPDRLHRAPVKAPTANKKATPAPCAFPELAATLKLVADKQKPTLKEIDLLWEAALNDFEARREQAANPAHLKRDIIKALLKGAAVAASFNSARTSFDVKRKAWLAGGKTLAAIANKKLRDNRPAPVVAEEKQKQYNWLQGHAGKFHAGKLPPARRELVEMGLLRPTRSKSKSYVPPDERAHCRRPAQIVAAFTESSRAVKEITPHIERDPDSIHSLKVLTADDCTPRVYCWWDGANGTEVGLGQLLATIDMRSWFVPMFSYQSDKNYNSHVVSALLGNTLKERGLWETFYFERGRIWRESKLLKGDDMKPNEWHEAFSESELVYGMERQLGIRFIHTLSPQAKSQVENMFGAVQRLMFGEPGFAGLDERTHLPDSTKRQLAEVRAGKVHPSKYFYHINEWRKRLEQIFEKYNHTAQQGRYLRGLTPFQAFSAFQDRDDLPTRFDERCAFMVTDRKSRRYVDHEGVIQFEVTGERYRFWNEHTATKLANSWRLCWWNPSLPDQVCVTDLQGRHAVVVPRSQRTQLANPEDPITQHEMGRQKKVAAALRATYHALSAPENIVYRQPVVSRCVEETSAAIKKQTARRTDAQREQITRERKAARCLEELGMPPALARGATAEQIQGWQEMAEAHRGEMKGQP